MPKIMQIISGVLEMWAVKHSGLSFLGHPVYIHWVQKKVPLYFCL